MQGGKSRHGYGENVLVSAVRRLKGGVSGQDLLVDSLAFSILLYNQHFSQYTVLACMTSDPGGGGGWTHPKSLKP